VAFFVYILASRRNGTLYVGMTDDLLKRIWQHRNDVIPGFTHTYNVRMLVWYESHGSREAALLRERRLKKWNRAWKLDLIEQENPQWRDLWAEVAGFDD
jgi:putative endonuclease